MPAETNDNARIQTGFVLASRKYAPPNWSVPSSDVGVNAEGDRGGDGSRTGADT